MILESLLAYAHIMAFLMLATFMTSETALCRAEWMNAADVDFVITHPEGYELAPEFVGNAKVKSLIKERFYKYLFGEQSEREELSNFQKRSLIYNRRL